MNRPTAVTLASLAAGLLCGALLLWLWRQDHAARAGFTRAAAPKALPPSVDAPDFAPRTPVTPADPKRAALIAALKRALLRRDVRPQEAVLTFRDDAALQRFRARAQNSGLAIVGELGRLRAVRVRFDAFRSLEEELLANGADYADAGGNNLVSIPLPPAREDRMAVDQVPFGNDTLAFMGANGDRRNWGRGTTIAIIDTGVAPDATFGAGRVLPLDIGFGINPPGGTEGGHGTAVAALAAGASPDAPGVAPAANLISIRVTDASGTSDLFTISQAILAAVDAGARVVNVSLGGYSTGAVLDAALDYATRQGALVVAAAGNDQAAQLAWPAADPRVISVGAVDKAEQQVSFSNSGAQLQFTAPGYGVQTAWLDGQRVYVDGTSASAPLVSGAIAAVLSLNPSLTPQQAADLLARTANDTGQPGADPAFGHGIVNLATALNSSNLNYVDTAVAGHFYDAASNQMQFTVQNRSGRQVSGLTLQTTVNGQTTTSTVPPLSPGQTFVASTPADAQALKNGGPIQYTTRLINPTGVIDQVPANNQRSSVLTAPTGKP